MVDPGTESPLINLGRLWVIENYPYNSTHLLKSLEWVDRIAPDASEAVRLATLTHDMERAFGGPDAIPIKLSDRAYEEAHSNRSARIVGEWLRANAAPDKLVTAVEGLIRVHEWGGSPEANLVQAADSLSFLETNIDLMLGFARTGKHSHADVAAKIDQMYERIQVAEAKELALPMWADAKARLASDPRDITGVRPQYLRPQSLDELLTLLHAHGPDARLLAGGTDLLVRAKKGPAFAPGFGEAGGSNVVLIDLKRVTELRADVAVVDAHLRIGARAVMTDLIENREARAFFPAVIEAARVVGSVQIRNRATIAGNVCNASPAADTAPALLAYGASLNLVSKGGARQMALDEFFTGPGRTVLAPGEVVASIDLPLPTERTGGAFARLTRRHGVDLAIVSVCCVVRESGDARFAFGAVGPRPFVISARHDTPLADVLTGARPISDLRASDEYRTAMLPVLTRRALTTAKARLQDVRSRERRGASGPPQASGWSGAGGPRD
jgi:CO/xanthine dehydrogenase FAD-binding subunit